MDADGSRAKLLLNVLPRNHMVRRFRESRSGPGDSEVLVRLVLTQAMLLPFLGISLPLFKSLDGLSVLGFR